MAEAVASGKALLDRPTSMMVEIGAKKMTDVPQQGGTVVSMYKMSQGVESLRQDFGEDASFKVGRRVFSQQCEKYVGGLSEAGMSTRGSELLSIQCHDMGTADVHGLRMYCTIIYESKIHVSTGVVRTLS